MAKSTVRIAPRPPLPSWWANLDHDEAEICTHETSAGIWWWTDGAMLERMSFDAPDRRNRPAIAGLVQKLMAPRAPMPETPEIVHEVGWRLWEYRCGKYVVENVGVFWIDQDRMDYMLSRGYHPMVLVGKSTRDPIVFENEQGELCGAVMPMRPPDDVC